MQRTARTLLAALAILASGCVLPGAGVSPYGRPTTLYPARGEDITGELIAANADSIWLLRSGQIIAYSSARIRKVNVERHRFDATKTFLWMGVAGAGTGLALTIACSNYYSQEGGSSGGDCAGVLPGTLLVFGGLGALFALSNNYSSMYHLVPNDTDRLRAHARFPQGIPDSVRLRPAPFVAAPASRQP